MLTSDERESQKAVLLPPREALSLVGISIQVPINLNLAFAINALTANSMAVANATSAQTLAALGL